MPNQMELEEMADRAKAATGWDGEEYVPIGELPDEDPDPDKARDDRSYAEGVESGLLWALGRAGDPLPR